MNLPAQAAVDRTAATPGTRCRRGERVFAISGVHALCSPSTARPRSASRSDLLPQLQRIRVDREPAAHSQPRTHVVHRFLEVAARRTAAADLAALGRGRELFSPATALNCCSSGRVTSSSPAGDTGVVDAHRYGRLRDIGRRSTGRRVSEMTPIRMTMALSIDIMMGRSIASEGCSCHSPGSLRPTRLELSCRTTFPAAAARAGRPERATARRDRPRRPPPRRLRPPSRGLWPGARACRLRGPPAPVVTIFHSRQCRTSPQSGWIRQPT